MITIIVTFILVLGTLILVHELGHFLTARIFGVKAEEFGFGYPPRIFGWVKDDEGKTKFIGHKTDSANFKNTVWSLNLLPLGGFVRIKGEDGENKAEPDSFGSRPVWQRFFMLFAGVFMNFVLCFVLLSIGFMAGIPSMVDDNPDPNLNAVNPKIQVISVMPASPAEQAGIQVGDEILSINNEPIKSISEVQELTSKNKNHEITLVISRATKKITYHLTPVSGSADAPGKIGTGLVKTAIVSYPWYESIYRGAVATITLTIAILTAFANLIADLFRTGTVSADVAGPVGIAVMTGQVAKLGWVYVMQFAALLSVNLAIINILPIPALDGGRILFLIIEKIKGSPVKQSREAAIHQIGFILLIALMALVIFRDIKTYIF